jgi:tetratricopeptide (TPR) repeat protein
MSQRSSEGQAVISAKSSRDQGVSLNGVSVFTFDAAGHYRAAARISPCTAYFQMNLGNALLKQKLYAEAATAFRHAGDNPDAINNLAYAYGELNANLDEAVALCERAIKLQPSHRAYYLDTLAGIQTKQGDMREAIATYEQALAATTDRQVSLRVGISQRLSATRALLKE